MDIQKLQDVVNLFFNRAVIGLSYSASARLLQRLTSSSAHGPNLSIVTIGITWICFLLLGERLLKQNACLQTTLSILVSKLIIQLCIPLEPNPSQFGGWMLPASICFFICLYGALCIILRLALGLESLRAQWDLIVPFIIIFSTNTILKAVKQNAELRFLYITILSFMIWKAHWEEDAHSYLTQFMDSIMARGFLLVSDDFIYGSSTHPTIGACLLFATWLAILYAWFPLEKRSPQWKTCIGVLTYSFCSRLLQVLKLLCNERITITFVLVVALIFICLYWHASIDVTTICANLLSILWSTMLDRWFFSFYQEWEQLLVYMILFSVVQAVKQTITPVLENSATLMLMVVNSTPPAALNDMADAQNVMLLASESTEHAAHSEQHSPQ